MPALSKRGLSRVTYIGFTDDQRAIAFGALPEIGSGHAFANRHLW